MQVKQRKSDFQLIICVLHDALTYTRVINLAKTTALENQMQRTNVRVNAVCPGYIDTPWFDRGIGEEAAARMRAGAAAGSPLKVASSAEDIAASTVFLGSRASRHVTGETLMVDAGYHLGFAPLVAR